jgi:hypothetical protein
MTHWLYPANTKFYDVFGAMDEKQTWWPMHSQVESDDKIFIYLAAPYKQIGFVCEVTDTGIEEAEVIEKIQPFIKGVKKPGDKQKHFMQLRPEMIIPPGPDNPLALAHLKQHGLSGMLMGARRLENNPVLLEYILRVYHEL